MTAQQIRDSFLKYFTTKAHAVVASSSLVPNNDASVLLTTAGMQQFKPYFLGELDPQKDFGAKRTSSIQKSFRTSDIDEVGDTAHLTFFEMLGNFSFGDYWKAEAIAWAWEYLTVTLKLDEERLWVTVFSGEGSIPRDDEAIAEWREVVPAEKIVAMDRATNFWGPPGTSGPCGPSSEIYWQLDPKLGGDPASMPSNFLEIWNLVFTEYFSDEQKNLSPLPQKNIDTGMGLERLAMVVQQADHVFDTDMFRPVMAAAAKIDGFGTSEQADVDARRLRIVADHLRAAVFLIGDGVRFSNKDQGYILRRIFRRAADQFMIMETSFDPVVEAILHHYAHAYPNLTAEATHIKAQMAGEMDQYRKILHLDVGKLVAKMRDVKAVAEPIPTPAVTALSSEEAFLLYSTHGISLDRLVRLGYSFDRPAVEERVTAHQELSRAGAEKKFGGHGLGGGEFDPATYPAEDIANMTRLHTATHLLQAALRKILGPEVKQNGSDINPERFRFDFTFPRKLTDEEKAQVEILVNEQIKADLPVTWKLEPYAQAIDEGALAFFKEKYPPEVKVYTIGNFSKELCGGPHVTHTAEVGTFKITAEQSVGSGLRRIKAVVA